VVSRNEVFKTLEKPDFAQFERVPAPFLANKLAEHSVDVFDVSFRPFQPGIVRVDSGELACGGQKSTPRLRVIRPTLTTPLPGPNTVAPTRLVYTFYDLRRLELTLSSGFPRVGAGPDTSQVLRKGAKVEVGPPPKPRKLAFDPLAPPC
jgi:hypothetical protein